MYGYIYKTTNLINQKIYIGQRKSEIFLGNNYLGSGKYIKYAIEKYGKENFQVELLDISDSREDLNKKEIYWIAHYKSFDHTIGYNIAKGGIGGGELWVNNGIENHHISLDKLSDFINAGYKIGMKPGRAGKSSSTRNTKISIALKGKSKPISQVSRQRESLKNRKQHWYTSGIPNDNLLLCESDDIPKGYYRGRTISDDIKKKCGAKNIGRTAWNKGLKKKLNKE